jgi:hypothetical protein
MPGKPALKNFSLHIPARELRRNYQKETGRSYNETVSNKTDLRKYLPFGNPIF